MAAAMEMPEAMAEATATVVREIRIHFHLHPMEADTNEERGVSKSVGEIPAGFTLHLGCCVFRNQKLKLFRSNPSRLCSRLSKKLLSY